MAKKSIELFPVAIILILALITTTAFINKSKHLSTGGGIAGGHLFNYTAEEYKGKITGLFSWDGEDFEIVCVSRYDNSALIYLGNGLAVEVTDARNGDRITAPFAASPDCSMTAVSY